MVVQTTFPVPSVIDAQRRTSQPLHQVTPSWPRTTTRKSLPVNNDSTPEQWRLDFQSRRDGRIALRISRHGTVAPCVGSRVASSSVFHRKQGSRQGGRVMSYLGHYVTGYSAIANAFSLVLLASSPVRH